MLLVGSIPACTGKPGRRRTLLPRQRVYPRVYGETYRPKSSAFSPLGLSPRVRGNLAGAAQDHGDEGSIPACTGKPMPSGSTPPRGWVYPRVYGETGRPWRLERYREGLSPRVRGNPEVASALHWVCGSIPACTGKPRSPGPSRTPPGVYPRVYGETTGSPEYLRLLEGLSPRVRGNLRTATGHAWGEGSIPACTGKPAT